MFQCEGNSPLQAPPLIAAETHELVFLFLSLESFEICQKGAVNYKFSQIALLKKRSKT